MQVCGGGDAMTDIEKKIQSLAPNPCRGCAHFIRVNFDGYYNVTNRQGFCLLGQLEGDWGLYVSSSISVKCAGFVFSEENAKIHAAERQLTDDMHKFVHSLHDKRTANYKAIKPLIDAHKDFFERTKNDRGDIAWMSADLKIRELGAEHFRKANAERFADVYHLVSLKRVHYMRFLAGVSVQIHDRFCDCSAIHPNRESPESHQTGIERQSATQNAARN